MAQPLPILVNAINRKKIYDLSTIENNQYIDPTESWNNSNRKIIIMRHGERVDTTFGLSWLEFSFSNNGKYIQKDLNMPKLLPNRKQINSWKRDVPLTNIGEHQAFLTGDAMQEAGVQIAYAYCSPVYRCVQTCSAFLSGKCYTEWLILNIFAAYFIYIFAGLGLKEKIQIRIEPGFFQYIGWEGIIDTLTPDELFAAGYNIDLKYIPILSQENLMEKLNQTLDEHYNNTYNCIQSILKENGNI